MALVVNGVTIPTNVANAITVNGVNITSVYHNAVLVWQQALGPTVGWSGDSLALGTHGLDSTGFNWRMQINTSYGAYITTDSNGVFTGSSTAASWSFTTSGSSFRINNTGGWIVYSPTTKQFSGLTGGITVGSNMAWGHTSGGLFRFQFNVYEVFNEYGAWVSLT